MTKNADVLATLTPDQLEQVLVAIAGIDPRNTTIIRELGAEYDRAVARARIVDRLNLIALEAISNSTDFGEDDMINMQSIQIAVTAIVDHLDIVAVREPEPTPEPATTAQDVADAILRARDNYHPTPTTSVRNETHIHPTSPTDAYATDYAERKHRHDESVAEAERRETPDTPEPTPSEHHSTDHALLDRLDADKPQRESAGVQTPATSTPAKFLTNHPEKADTNGISSPHFGKHHDEPAGRDV